MYIVDGKEFTSFMQAVDAAYTKGVEVVEKATGLTRWRPASKPRPDARTAHVLVEEDGTERPIGRVRRR